MSEPTLVPEIIAPEEVTDAAETVRRVAALVAQHQLAELTVEDNGLTITVKGAALDSAPAPVITTPSVAFLPVPTAKPALPAPPKASKGTAQESPMVGVFFRSPTPEDPPFVNVGDIISVGQTIGLIEAMKVYSELPSELAGRILEIPAVNGKLVQQGQPLIVVETA